MDRDRIQHQLNEEQRLKALAEMVAEAVTRHGCKTIHDVALRMQSLDKDITIEELEKVIKRLESENKIEMHKQKTDSFVKYILDTRISGSLWLVLGFVMLTLSSIYFLPHEVPWSMLRTIVGGIFVLFMPGYALIRLLKMKSMDSAETIVLSVGLSLALTSLIGLMLNYSPWGLTLETVTASLGAASIGMVFISVYRRFLKVTAQVIRTL